MNNPSVCIGVRYGKPMSVSTIHQKYRGLRANLVEGKTNTDEHR
ncbi:hypothetical protein [Fischerella sp. JS2]|nr:hypothetical protein [Fischerella sp. JS2]